MSSWKDGGETYLPGLGAAEITFGIPAGLLARIAFQESSWKTSVVNGTEKSAAGCVGLMQLNPRFFPDAGHNWQADVVIAAKYLASLYQRFHDWQLACAAYNWGPTAVAHYLADENMDLPTETRRYVNQVFSDVPLPGCLV